MINLKKPNEVSREKKQSISKLTPIPSENKATNKYMAWLQWEENSCRYDSFLTVFSLGLYGKFHEFDKTRADKRHKNHKAYLALCNIAKKLEEINSPAKRRHFVNEFSDYLYELKIDENRRGEMGCAQELLTLLLPLFHLQPFIEEEIRCGFCGFKEERRIRWPLPLKVHQFGSLQFNSIQKYFDWFAGSRSPDFCEVCFQKELRVVLKQTQIPNLIIVECINAGKMTISKQNKFEFNSTIISKSFQAEFELVATINQPCPYHFNCSILKPRNFNFQEKDESRFEWFLHDNIENEGSLVAINNISELWDQNPILLFYARS